MSGQRRLLDNKMTSEGKLDAINNANGENLNEKAMSIKEITCGCSPKKKKGKKR